MGRRHAPRICLEGGAGGLVFDLNMAGAEPPPGAIIVSLCVGPDCCALFRKLACSLATLITDRTMQSNSFLPFDVR